MSKYNFKCEDCKKTFVISATLEEKENNKFSCPSCESNKTRGQFSISAFLKNIFSKDSSGEKCCSGNESSCDTKCNPKDGKGDCC